MTLQQRIGHALGIREDETSKILIIIGTSVFMGVGIFMYYTGAIAIFLTEFQETALPYVYIINAVLVMFTGAIYSGLQSKITLKTRLYGSSAFLAITSLAVWLAFSLTQAAAVAFVMLICYRLLFVFGTMDGWELMGAVFDVHQAKRLFGLGQVGGMLGGILGATLGAILAPIVGATHLILIASGVLTVYLVLQLRYIPRLEPFNLPDTDRTTREATAVSTRELFKSRFILLIFGLKICLVLTMTVTEFLFSQQAALNFPDEDALASFWGGYFALSSVVAMLLVAFVSGRFISHFGMRITLLATPVLVMLVTILVTLYSTFISSSDTAFFAMVSAMMMIMWVFPFVWANPAQNILLQPLPPRLRASARIAIEGGLGSIALMAAGILILVLTGLSEHSTSIVLALLITVGGLWLGLAVLSFRQYAQRLIQAVSLRFLRGIDPNHNASDTHEIMPALSSNHSDDLNISMAFTQDANNLKPFYAELLQHPDPQIQRDILQRIAQQPQSGLSDKLQTMVFDANLPLDVRADAIRAWVATDPSPALNALSGLLTDAEPRLLVALIPAMLREGSAQQQASARARIQDWLQADDTQALRYAAQALGNVPALSSDDPLLQLLAHENPAIVREAIFAAGQQHLTQARKAQLWARLAQRRYQSVIIRAIQAHQSLLPEIKTHLVHADQQQAIGFIRLLGKIGTDDACGFLETQLLHTSDWTLRRTIIIALQQAGYMTPQPDTIQALMDAYTALISQIVRNQLMAHESGWELLERALHHEFLQKRQTLLYLHALVYDREAILGIVHHLGYVPSSAMGNLLETIEILLPKDRAAVILPLLEEISLPERAQALNAQITPETARQEILQQIAMQGTIGWAGTWTQACAIQTLADAFGSAATPILEAIQPHHPLLKEIVADAWGQFHESTQEKPSHTMLTTLEKFSILKNTSLFADMPEYILVEIATEMHEKHFKQGERILRKEDQGDVMYLVAEGHLAIHLEEKFDQSTVIEYIQRLGVVGEFSVLDSKPRSAFVTAAEPVTLLALDQATLFELMSIYPEIIQGIMSVLLEKLRSTTLARSLHA